MKLHSTLLVFGMVFVGSSYCDNVPVFLWGTKTTIHTPALKTFESENFNNFLRKQLSDDVVTVVFYENNLSTKDLGQCKNADGTTCFTYLNSIKPSSYMPSVENPMETLERYHEENQLSTHLNTDGSFNLDFNDIEKGDIVFVSLADSSENEESSDIFSRHDGVIRKFVEQLDKKFEIVGIYTGNHAPAVHSLYKRDKTASKLEPKPKDKSSSSMPTKPTALGNGLTLYPNENILIVFTRFYELTSDKQINITVTKVTTREVSSKSIKLTLEADKGSLNFEINEFANTYSLENVTFRNQSMRNEEISVNLPFSFHCGPGVIFRSKSTELVVVLEGLQFEPQFNRTTFNLTRFSESWVCVGFTSGGVWMGLVVSFLLTSVLLCGISWLFDIKAMDRFDDPKGKTITVIEME